MTAFEHPTRATDRTLPVSVVWPIRDDNTIELWLVPGNWSRGLALAHVSGETGIAFVDLRARRCYMRFAYLQRLAGWSFDDGTLTHCERDDAEAERYWEVWAK